MSGSLDAFAAMTQRIIATDGFDGYLPTAIYPARKHVVVLEGVPAGSDIEAIAVAWAEMNAEHAEEFLVAFPISSSHFKVVHRSGATTDFGTFPAYST